MIIIIIVHYQSSSNYHEPFGLGHVATTHSPNRFAVIVHSYTGCNIDLVLAACRLDCALALYGLYQIYRISVITRAKTNI